MQAPPHDGPDSRPTQVRWEIFAVSLTTSALLYLHRYSFAFIKPLLAEQWQLTNTQLGQFDSVFALSYSACQFPLAVAADLAGVRRLLALLITIWASGLALLSAAPGRGWVAAAQGLFGAGQSAVYACLTRIARVWYPLANRTTLQGLVSVLAGRLGALSASLVVSTVMLGAWEWPWRTTVGFLAISAAALVLVTASVVRDSPQVHPRVNWAERQLIVGGSDALDESAAPHPPSGSMWASLRSRASPRLKWLVAALSIQAVLSTFADNVYSNWLPQFLSQVHHLDFKRMGVYSMLPLLGGAVAGLVGGLLNDRLIARTGRRGWSRAGVAIAGKGLAAVVLFAALTQFHRPYVFCGLLFVVKALGDWSLVSALGAITDSGGRATASLFALVNTVAGIGQVSAPVVFGAVSDHYGWQPVFVIVACAYVACAISWLALGRLLESPPHGLAAP